MTPEPRIHATAIVEEDVTIGPGTSVWDHVHIRQRARVGSKCIIGAKTYIAPGVRIGDLVKINTAVYLCAGVTVDDGAMISAHVVFTNDRHPRATDPDLTELRSSEPPDDMPETRVCRGATVGAGATIGPGITLGEWSMVGMGSVVTRDVAPHTLVRGNPARAVALVCRCGHPVLELDGAEPAAGPHTCPRCGREMLAP